MELSVIAVIAAALPEDGGYVSLYKLGGILLVLLAWAGITVWVDHDTNVVKTKREQWNVIVTAGGVVGFFVLLVLPMKGPLFFAGLGFWLLIAGGAQLAYIIHRNGRVLPTARILTPDHLRRLLTAGSENKKRAKDKGQRIKLHDHTGKAVEPPQDPEENEDYQVTQDFLFDLLWRRTSEVDVLAGREKYRVVVRVDGVASEKADGLAPEDGERIFRFLKKIAGLNVQEIRRPQTGKIKAATLAHTGDLGETVVQTSGTTAGERLRLRLHLAARLFRLQELGIPEPRLVQLKTAAEQASGLVLITALPENGMTTTQYAVLRTHDVYMQNVHTLERRMLLPLDNITQQVYDGSNPEVSYGRMLQTVIRREPDVVMVSECEDRETAQVATGAALDDRKIYLGMHAKDCFDALSQYLSLVDDNASAAQALIVVLNQRLVRILCTECREAFRPDPTMLKKLNLPAEKIERFYRPPTEPLVDKKGREIICSNCQGTGYVGRTGIFELLVVDDGIKKLMAEGASSNRIKAQARKNKMYYLQEEGLLKVIDGTTSMNEILRVLRDGTK
ncbi:MAG TPA: ATPase, T2SS/T4P/T4SS family [Phycisphaerae bacterium]|nr:ATPase, T2SS/T4P/T4SS family [Phycisphaerae bacterium]HNU46869.1 ATPase, T2SS/T4P/T4SS family [Phycisphaerae bacterium]